MINSKSPVSKALFLAAFLVPAAFVQTGSAQNTSTRVQTQQQQIVVQPQIMQRVLRKVSPQRGRLVRRGSASSFASNGGPQELTCCTHWNTQSGGTGCASYDDSDGMCPDNTFQVDCGPTGCW